MNLHSEVFQKHPFEKALSLTVKHGLPITQSDKERLPLQTLCFALQPEDMMGLC